ncbi:cystathionine beta-lyase/cystathionine gamma-synthase [Bernardetia litoralis DSM 6794]|uniref:Cystathionine beta-lyase/cystathionine gamma-synthase n=1 Tax=Bernardetia litoralis (strain ATCC 23117 / DSM 6794 / NBRC 15988 / NCIMB 1366 / Fx l1 / Sio-4) TaxID=880071 RepID=I4AF79_BERLS|nr:cystathionine gamma-synthase [Bernardetia litoralis]AFM02614.1 cystathionine beta-lyase/cystathionine gamma-synthase [Bernardetia litoralis DSM 6794]
MKFATKAIHAGVEPDPSTGAIMTPIFQTSTFAQPAVGQNKGFEYARSSNPTRQALEKSFAALENAKHGFAFSSGMAATDTIMKLLKPNDEVICGQDIYGGSYRLFVKVYEEIGIKFHFIDMQNEEIVKNTINSNSKMIWIETPSNPLLQIVDIEKIIKIAKENNLISVVDNTFATPYLQNPITMGADIAMHSATKYLGGHSDVVMGALMLNNDELAEKIYFIQKSCGAVPSPFDCFLMLRGIKTLPLRVDASCKNAIKIADFLVSHEKVENVYYAGLTTHKGHNIAQKQMRQFGGMISFDLKQDTQANAYKFLENINVFALAESLGGVESLACYPAMMTHASIPIEKRHEIGITDSLVRLSIGCEDVDDLIEDLEQALMKITFQKI